MRNTTKRLNFYLIFVFQLSNIYEDRKLIIISFSIFFRPFWKKNIFWIWQDISTYSWIILNIYTNEQNMWKMWTQWSHRHFYVLACVFFLLRIYKNIIRKNKRKFKRMRTNTWNFNNNSIILQVKDSKVNKQLSQT